MENAKLMGFYQAFSGVVSAALGGGKKKPMRAPESGIEAEMMFNNVMGIKSAPSTPSQKDPFSGLDDVFEKL